MLMDSDCAAEVLRLCYQAVMEYQEIDDITPETERQYPALLETIRFQKELDPPRCITLTVRIRFEEQRSTRSPRWREGGARTQ